MSKVEFKALAIMLDNTYLIPTCQFVILACVKS